MVNRHNIHDGGDPMSLRIPNLCYARGRQLGKNIRKQAAQGVPKAGSIMHQALLRRIDIFYIGGVPLFGKPSRICGRDRAAFVAGLPLLHVDFNQETSKKQLDVLPQHVSWVFGHINQCRASCWCAVESGG
ncbi:hypothetical protein HAX54_032354 [Datura stramonium]|uniref:Uncharacterized protein n=1 Tax=Datura stramonium TaxID=4076 RepID=A0ABS8VCX0_DATST|nr:hypothetical protein [Datura stramonium]